MSDQEPEDLYALPSDTDALFLLGAGAVAAYLTLPEYTFADCLQLALEHLKEKGRIKGPVDEARFRYHFRGQLLNNPDFGIQIEREGKEIFIRKTGGMGMTPADYRRRLKPIIKEIAENGVGI